MIAAIVALLVRLLLGPSIEYRYPFADAKPRVFFANHSSHLDFLVVWSTLPAVQRRQARPVAARDYWTQGPVRRFIAGRFFGGLMIERHHPTSEDNPIEQMLGVLDQQQSLILFPEGTRGSGEAIAPFRAGLFYIHEARPDVELMPVHLENLNRVLPKGEFLPVPLLSRVTFGEPLASTPDEGRGDFLERARQALIELEAS